MPVLYMERLDRVVVGDRDPLLVRRRPLELIDFRVGRVGQDRIIHRFGQGRQIPDQRLAIIRTSAEVARRVRRPGDGVDARLVRSEFGHGNAGHADIEYQASVLHRFYEVRS